MRLWFKIWAISSLLAAPFALSACTPSNFTAANSSKKTSADANGSSTVSVPVGGQKPIPDLPAGDIKSCTSVDPTIATVDSKTCVVTGVKVGTTTVNAVMSDGTKRNVSVTVTPTANNTSVTVPVGTKQTIPSLSGSNNITSCTSTNTSIATVDPKTCVVTGVKVGTTTVNAVMADGTKQAVSVVVTPASQNGALTVPVGTQQNIPNVGTNSGSTCTSANTAVATVDPTTCVVTGVTSGNTDVKVTSSDGTTQTVPVTVTDDGTTPANDPLATDDGETSISGRVCLGGPACNISYVTRTEDEATACMQTANSQPCQNDAKCGSNYQLQVCNCDCESTTPLPFISADACLRSNPLKPGANERIAACHKI